MKDKIIRVDNVKKLLVVSVGKGNEKQKWKQKKKFMESKWKMNILKWKPQKNDIAYSKVRETKRFADGQIHLLVSDIPIQPYSITTLFTYNAWISSYSGPKEEDWKCSLWRMQG